MRKRVLPILTAIFFVVTCCLYKTEAASRTAFINEEASRVIMNTTKGKLRNVQWVNYGKRGLFLLTTFDVQEKEFSRLSFYDFESDKVQVVTTFETHPIMKNFIQISISRSNEVFLLSRTGLTTVQCHFNQEKKEMNFEANPFPVIIEGCEHVNSLMTGSDRIYYTKDNDGLIHAKSLDVQFPRPMFNSGNDMGEASYPVKPYRVFGKLNICYSKMGKEGETIYRFQTNGANAGKSEKWMDNVVAIFDSTFGANITVLQDGGSCYRIMANGNQIDTISKNKDVNGQLPQADSSMGTAYSSFDEQGNGKIMFAESNGNPVPEVLLKGQKIVGPMRVIRMNQHPSVVFFTEEKKGDVRMMLYDGEKETVRDMTYVLN